MLLAVVAPQIGATGRAHTLVVAGGNRGHGGTAIAELPAFNDVLTAADIDVLRLRDEREVRLDFGRAAAHKEKDEPQTGKGRCGRASLRRSTRFSQGSVPTECC